MNFQIQVCFGGWDPTIIALNLRSWVILQLVTIITMFSFSEPMWCHTVICLLNWIFASRYIDRYKVYFEMSPSASESDWCEMLFWTCQSIWTAPVLSFQCAFLDKWQSFPLISHSKWLWLSVVYKAQSVWKQRHQHFSSQLEANTFWLLVIQF